MSEALLYADSARGIYIPQYFAQTIKRDALSGVRQIALDILAAGPDACDTNDGNAEYYWDEWQYVLDNATVTDNGITYHLHQDGDLWLIPDGMVWDDENECYVWPDEEETALTQRLKALPEHNEPE